MSNNFLQFNPTKANQENDAAYTADAQRTGGAATNSIFASQLANKLFYQLSTMITALGQALSNKGYTVSDADLTALINVLSNLITTPDLVPYAKLASPVFTGDPKAPTPLISDNDTSIATTAFVQALLASFSSSFVGNNGYIKFPFFGGLIIQWMIGTQDPAGEFTVTKNFPIPFPNRCFVPIVTYGATPATQANDGWYQVVSFNASSVTLFKQGTGGTQQVSSPYIIAIGF